MSGSPAAPSSARTQANRARLIERPITWEDRVWLSWGADASVILKA